jgi:hypothetical protein
MQNYEQEGRLRQRTALWAVSRERAIVNNSERYRRLQMRHGIPWALPEHQIFEKVIRFPDFNFDFCILTFAL